MNKKGFIGIVIIILLALGALGGGAYYAWQKNNQSNIKPNNSSKNNNVSTDTGSGKYTIPGYGEKDCGEITLGEGAPAVDAATCLSDAILSCTPAKATVDIEDKDGPFTETFEVFGRLGTSNDCNIYHNQGIYRDEKSNYIGRGPIRCSFNLDTSPAKLYTSGALQFVPVIGVYVGTTSELILDFKNDKVIELPYAQNYLNCEKG